MMTDTATFDRLLAYGKSLGVDGSAVGMKSAVQSFTRVKAGQDGVYDYIATANTDDIDLDNEVVLPGGADKSYIEVNRMMFADHNYTTNDVVGKIRAFTRYPNSQAQTAWKVRFRLAPTEVGRTTKAIVDEYGEIGLSIGFFARDYGPPDADEKTLYTREGKTPSAIVRKWDWFELSTTALPSNKSCRIEGVRSDEKYAANVERMVTKGLISREGAARLGLPIGEDRKSFAIPKPRRVLLPSGGVIVRRD